jgi:hypothetical protein
MSVLVTMRIALDPVLKEQLKLRAIERGMTRGELFQSSLSMTSIGARPRRRRPE